MELIKKTVEVSDANGWYLLETQKRFWLEAEIDEESGNPIEIERSEVLCKKGVLINDITQSMLQENGIIKVRVSNVPLLGQQDKNMNLWEAQLKVRTNKGNSKQSYIVTADSPRDAETFLAEWFEIHIDGTCEFVGVKTQDYSKVIKLYDTEREEMDREPLWYKCQMYSMIDDDNDEDSHSAGSKNILVQASSFENAISAVKTVMNRSEFDAIYNTIKLLSELKLEEVFVPDENASYYSEADID